MGCDLLQSQLGWVTVVLGHSSDEGADGAGGK
jgi:hypothetical protein